MSEDTPIGFEGFFSLLLFCRPYLFMVMLVVMFCGNVVGGFAFEAADWGLG